MKRLLSLMVLVGFAAQAQVPPPPAASQTEVNAGTVKNKYVSPATLKGWTGGGTNPNVITNTQTGVTLTGPLAITNGVASTIQFPSAGFGLSSTNQISSGPAGGFGFLDFGGVNYQTISASNIVAAQGTFIGNGSGLTNVNLNGTLLSNPSFKQTNYVVLNEQFATNANGTLPGGWVTQKLNGWAGSCYCTNSPFACLIVSNGGSYPQTLWLYNTNPLCYNGMPHYHERVIFQTLQTNNSADDGIYIGNLSGNAFDLNSQVFGFYTGLQGGGGLIEYNGLSTAVAANRPVDTFTNGGVSLLTNGIAIASTYVMDLIVDDVSMLCTCSNTANGRATSLAMSQDISTTGVTNGYVGSSGYPAICFFQGSFLITNCLFEPLPPMQIDGVVFGDSLAVDSRASLIQNGCYHQFTREMAAIGESFLIVGHGSDTSSNNLQELPLLNLCLGGHKPDIFMYEGGANDVNTGYPYQSFIPAIMGYNSYSPAATNASYFMLLGPLASNAGVRDTTPVSAWENNTYPNWFVPTVIATKNTGTQYGSTNYMYLPEGYHPNDKGQADIFRVICSWLRLRGKYMPY